MPSKSKKQARFMAAVANNPSFAKKAGVSQSVGREFADADKGRKFAGGGVMPSYYDSKSGRPGTAVRKYQRGDKVVSRAHRKKAIRNIDDEIYRTDPKTYDRGVVGRDARDEYERDLREKRFEKRALNMQEGGAIASSSSTPARGAGIASQGVRPCKIV